MQNLNYESKLYKCCLFAPGMHSTALTGKIYALSTKQRILATVALAGIIMTLLATAE